jgi:hypothetical protein
MPDPPRGRVVDPRLWNVAPDVLRGRNDQPVSVTSPALEWAAIQASAITSPGGRALYQWELDTLQDIFQSGLDASRIRVVETRILNAPTTLAGQIRVPHGWSFDGDNKPVLVHESTHVWQYQTRGTNYITDSVYHNASGQIATGNRNVAYMNYQLQPNSNLSDFTAEEQATIVADYYEITRLHQNDATPPQWVVVRRPDLPIYERLIQQVRSAMPLPDTRIYQNSLMNQPQPGFDWSTPGPGGMQAPAVMPLLQVRFRGL